MHVPTREEAWTLLTTYTKTDNLLNHARSVESVMRHYARRYGEDEEKWGIIGLVHDLDWEQFPAEHCNRTAAILREADWPEEWIRAIQSHGWKICTDVEPHHRMEKVLYAIDELTGLVTATALVRPSRSLQDMTPKSVKKKWKQPSFAAGANREIIAAGAEMMDEPLDSVIAETLEAMKTVASEIGLDGEVRS